MLEPSSPTYTGSSSSLSSDPSTSNEKILASPDVATTNPLQPYLTRISECSKEIKKILKLSPNEIKKILGLRVVPTSKQKPEPNMIDIEAIKEEKENERVATKRLETDLKNFTARFIDTLIYTFNNIITTSKTLPACLPELFTEIVKQTKAIEEELIILTKRQRHYRLCHYHDCKNRIDAVRKEIIPPLDKLKGIVEQLFLKNTNQIPCNSSKLACIILLTKSLLSHLELESYLNQLFEFSKKMEDTNQLLAMFLQAMNQAYKRSSCHIFPITRYKELDDIIKRLEYAATKSPENSKRPTHRSSTYTALALVLSETAAEELYRQTKEFHEHHTDQPPHEAFLAIYAKKKGKRLPFSLKDLSDFFTKLSELIQYAFEIDKALFNKTCARVPDLLCERLPFPVNVKNEFMRQRKLPGNQNSFNTAP